MRYRPFEHLSMVFILVEAELDEGANPAAALGRAVDNGVLDPIAQRILWACPACLRLAFPLRRKEIKSRVAAKPKPITIGFFAV